MVCFSYNIGKQSCRIRNFVPWLCPVRASKSTRIFPSSSAFKNPSKRNRSSYVSGLLSHSAQTKSPVGKSRPLPILVKMSLKSGILLTNFPEPKETLLPQWLQISISEHSLCGIQSLWCVYPFCRAAFAHLPPRPSFIPLPVEFLRL